MALDLFFKLFMMLIVLIIKKQKNKSEEIAKESFVIFSFFCLILNKIVKTALNWAVFA